MRLLKIVVMILLGLGAAVVALTDPSPLTPLEVSKLTIALNEAAAIGVPHDFLMEEKIRDANLAILTKVEAGTELTADENLSYRKLFQKTLQDNQNFLGFFDRDFAILTNHAMQTNNNVAAQGIPGHHDHHDSSARNNFAQLLQSLEKLNAATSSFGRIRYANVAQKDLVDLISHVGVAPHTVSVLYTPPDVQWSDPNLGAQFESMLKNYKAAQFASVNSHAYWSAVDAALQDYDALILAVQNEIVQRTSTLERRFAGRFMSMQTLAPPVNLTRPLRRK